MADHVTIVPAESLQVNTPAGPVRFRCYQGATVIEVEKHNLRDVVISTGFFHSTITLTNNPPEQD